MGFKLPWFGKKQDNAQAVPPVPAAPSDTPPAVDMSVPPVVTAEPSGMSHDVPAPEASDVPPAAAVEQAAQDVTEQSGSAFSADVSLPTSPAADLMGQTAPEPSEVPTVPEQNQPSVESTPTFDAAPAPEVSAPEVSVPESDAPTVDTPEQPEEAPKNQF